MFIKVYENHHLYNGLFVDHTHLKMFSYYQMHNKGKNYIRNLFMKFEFGFTIFAVFAVVSWKTVTLVATNNVFAYTKVFTRKIFTLVHIWKQNQIKSSVYLLLNPTKKHKHGIIDTRGASTSLTQTKT